MSRAGPLDTNDAALHDTGMDDLSRQGDRNAGQPDPRSNTSSIRGPHVVTEEELQHSVLIFYIVLFVMIASQSALVRWRTRHRRSYDLVTLLGLWLVPAIMSVQLHFWRFLVVWICYTLVTGKFLYT
jgi:hypothetical protein